MIRLDLKINLSKNEGGGHIHASESSLFMDRYFDDLHVYQEAFFQRQTENGAVRGAVRNEKRSPRVHCILGKLHTKNEGLNDMKSLS